MSDEPTYSYRDGEYRADGKPIDVLAVLTEFTRMLAIARDEIERLRKQVTDMNPSVEFSVEHWRTDAAGGGG